MTSRLKKIVLVIGLLILASTLLTACQLGTTLEAEKEKFGVDAVITYHGNGGFINAINTQSYADVYYNEGSLAMNVGTDQVVNGTFFVERANYTLVGWYYPELDDENNLVYEDAKNEIVKIDETKPFDFKNYRVAAGDDIDLYAYWLPNQKLEYVLAAESSIDNTLIVKDEMYVAGDIIRLEDFRTSTKIYAPTPDPLLGAATGYNFAGYYWDEQCTDPVTWPIARTNSGSNLRIYVKYLSLDWTVIANASDLSKLFGNKTNNGKFFIKNDINVTSDSIVGSDNTSKYITLVANSSFSGEIRGNGHTISGLYVRNRAVANSEAVSLLGSIESGARISDLTIKDFKIEFYANSDASIEAYLFASTISEGASISNVKIDGGELLIRTQNGASWSNQQELAPICKGGCDGISVVAQPQINHKK